MSEKEILDWLFEQSSWDDLTKVEVTTYHINWTCNWAREIVINKPKFAELPLPQEILRAISVELFGINSIETPAQNFSWRRQVRRRFLDSLESEQSSVQQI